MTEMYLNMFSVSGNMVLALFSGYAGPTLVHKRVRHAKCTGSQNYLDCVHLSQNLHTCVGIQTKPSLKESFRVSGAQLTILSLVWLVGVCGQGGSQRLLGEGRVKIICTSTPPLLSHRHFLFSFLPRFHYARAKFVNIHKNLEFLGDDCLVFPNFGIFKVKCLAIGAFLYLQTKTFLSLSTCFGQSGARAKTRNCRMSDQKGRAGFDQKNANNSFFITPLKFPEKDTYTSFLKSLQEHSYAM